MQQESYLVIVVGERKAVLAQCYSATEEKGIAAVGALFTDTYGEPVTDSACIDTGAAPGVWLESTAEYMRGRLAEHRAS